MADTFGKQGGMEGIVSAGNNMQQASKTFGSSSGVFKTSVGKWSFGVYMLKDAFEKFNVDATKTFAGNRKTFLSDIKAMGGIITAAFTAFGKAKWIDTIADMVNSIYGVRKSLESTYGAFGAAGDSFRNGILAQSKITNEFGARWAENMASFSSIADKLGTTNFDMDMVGNNTILAKAMDMSEEMASNITTAFKFAGATTQNTMDFMENINKGATKLGLSPSLVAQNIAASEKSMMRFAVNTERGRSKLQQMALVSSKMGTNIDNMVSAMDEFRTVGGAMQGSANLSLLGMNTNAMELLANARNSDPSKFFEDAMKHLEKFADPTTGQLNPVGYDIANALGPMLNMSFEEIQKSLYRMKDPTDKGLMMAHYKTMKERAVLMQSVLEKISNAMYDILKFLSPAIDKITGAIDRFANGGPMFKAVIVALSIISIILGKILSARLSNAMAGSSVAPNVFNMPDLTGGKRRTVKTMNAMARLNRTGVGLINAETGRINAQAMGEASKIRAQSVRMLAAVPAILAFGGSILMLAKAFKMFGEVNWQSAKYGGLVMAGMVASFAILSKTTVGWEAAAVLGAIGVSALLSATAFKIMSAAILPLLGQGMALTKLAAGLSALSISMTVFAVNSLGSLTGGVSLWAAGKSIEKIGEIAVKYSSPINELANGIGNLSNALYRLQTMSIQPINLDGIKQLNDIAVKYPKLLSPNSGSNSSGNKSDVVHVHLHSVIELDGMKLGEATAGTLISLNSGRGGF